MSAVTPQPIRKTNGVNTGNISNKSNNNNISNNGGLLVAFWGFLGGIPFCNALKVNALRAQKTFICFICVYKNIYRGLFANANPHIFLCFLIPVRRKNRG